MSTFKTFAGTESDQLCKNRPHAREGVGVDIEIVDFSRQYDRSSFDCGKSDLNDWLRTQAGQAHDNRSAVTKLAISAATEDIVGYYASCVTELGRDNTATVLGIGKRAYPMPAILLARLAVDQQFAGRGIGSKLLVDALESFVDVARTVAVQVVIVDAIDDDAAGFYERNGFERLQGESLRLFLPMKTLISSLI